MIDILKLLSVIAMLEGGPHPPQAYGIYGISPGVLLDVNRRRGYGYTVADLDDTAVSLVVARDHLDWLTLRLRHRGIQPTAAILAGCWRAGLTGWLQGQGRDYGASAANLYSVQ